MSEKGLCQQDPDFLSALQFAHFAGVQLVGNVEPLQQNGGVALVGVAVLFADNAFEFAKLHAVGVGDLGLLVDGVAFLHCAHRRLLPMMTVSIAEYASKANWSWLSTPNLRGRTTVP